MDKLNTSSSQPQSQIEEETTSFYRSKNKSFNSYGIPLKPSDQSAVIQKNREREKRELSHLNDRFATYIERVRFLEAHNKKLQLEIDDLRGKWGLQTNQLKEKYNVEIHQARLIIDDTTKDRTVIDLRVKRNEEEKIKLKDKYELLLAGRDSDREKIELLQNQLLDNERDLNLFHRRLIDLEDEKKRYSDKSQKLILDIQQITKKFDDETIIRIDLENQKQTLEEEINFLKEIHLEEIEELKQINLFDKTLDSTKFFKHELANAIQNIRQEYEQLNQQQRNEIQSWYQLKVTQAIQEIQSHQAIKKSENIREQEEIKKLRTLVSDSQQDIVTMHQRNGELENRIRELEQLIQTERNNNIQTLDQRDRNINDLKIHLEDLGRNYDELISTKSSLDSEITIYRKLLEGEEKRKGLEQIVENIIEEQTQLNSTVVSKSPTYQRTDESQESKIRSSTDHDMNSSSDDNIRNNSEPIQSIIHEQSVRLQHKSESSNEGTDYDSSIEDPNERLASYHKKN